MNLWCCVCNTDLDDDHSLKCSICLLPTCTTCFSKDNQCKICTKIASRSIFIKRKHFRKMLKTFEFESAGQYERIIDFFIDVILDQNPDDLKLNRKLLKALHHSLNPSKELQDRMDKLNF